MTDKQSTVVVPNAKRYDCELPVFEAGGMTSEATQMVKASDYDELRALLAARAEQSPSWESLARKLAWYLPGALEANAVHMSDETMHDALEALDQVRRMPVGQSEQVVDVGEPYAWAYSHTGFVESPVNKPVLTTERWPELYGIYSEIPLYRHAQPPAKVGMADVMRAFQSANTTNFMVGTSNWCAHLAEQLNTPQD